MYKYLLLITSLLVIWFTSLVSIPGSPYLIGGYTQADISAMFPTAITPAGITFAIWSVIYISWVLAGLAVSRVFMSELIAHTFLGALRYLVAEEKKRVIYSFSLAIFLTALWLIPWGNLWIGTSLIIMLLLLGVLKYTFHHTRKSGPLVKWSVELTLGWINIATVANVTIWLVSIGFTGWSIPELYWAIGVLGLALLLTTYYQCRYHSYIISLVFLWTMIGEWMAHDGFEFRVAIMIYSIATLVNIGFSLRKQKYL